MDRKCTDPFVCLIFFVFFCGMFATAAYGYAWGDPMKIMTPFDSDGNQCGMKNLTDYKYIFFPDVIESLLNAPSISKSTNITSGTSLNPKLLMNTVCVSSCPSFMQITKCYKNKVFDSCPIAYTSTSLCKIPQFTCSIDLNRYCLPNIDKAKEAMLNIIADGDLGRYMSDLATTWWVLLVLAGVSMVLGFIYLVLLRLFAKPLLYISIVMILGLLIGGGFYVFFLGSTYEAGDQTRNAMHGMGILLWIISGLYFLILCCCWSRIKLGASIIEAASDFVANTPSIFFVPLLFFFIVGIWVVFWVISAVFVYSVGDATKSATNPIFADMKWNNTTRQVWIYHLFGLFWISAFIIGCAQFVIAAVACLWYFSHGGASDDKNTGGVLLSVKWVLKYHMGSIAFGSAIIAIMQMIKIAFEYFRRKSEALAGNSAIICCILCCVRYCIWCLDSCVRFITKNAYIQIALTSNSFCSSALATFCLIIRNAGRFTMVSSIGFILMFLGKSLIMVLSGWIAYLIIVNSPALKDQVYSPIFPVVIVVVIAYLIGSIFLSIFSFSSTAILHCFILDSELCTKNGKANIHTPESLKSFIEVNDQDAASRAKYEQSKQQPNANGTL
jgi:hypothetical protein